MNCQEMHREKRRDIEMFVRQHPGCTARDIGKALDSGHVSATLAEMRRDGIVRAEPVRTGRRGNDRAFAYYAEAEA